MFQASYNPSMGVAGLTDIQSGISVYTLLQNPGYKRPSVHAYLAARYSRSNKSIESLLQEVDVSQVDAAERLERIFAGYGHASVAGMAHLFCCVENVPATVAARFFYLCPIQDGQERSTRYQDFSQHSYFPTRFPTSLPTKLRIRFSNLLKAQLQSYIQLIPTTQQALQKAYSLSLNNPKHVSALRSRTFDTVRLLLPMGICTNFGAIQSAREWSRYISLMKSSPDLHEQIVGKLLYALLTGTKELRNLGYVPEAAELIRHVKPCKAIEETTTKLVAACEYLIKTSNVPKLRLPNVAVGYTHARMALLEHVAMLAQPGVRLDYTALQKIENFAKFIHTVHSQYKPLGPIGQHGAIQIRGFADVGCLKDLNRHRCLEHFIPFLDHCANPEKELINGFTHCAYLQSIPYLRTHLLDTYTTCLSDYYKNVTGWAKEAAEFLSRKELMCYVRYLLPQAHRTEYAFYGSVDDLIYVINTRIRPEGHINYRLLVYSWLSTLAESHNWWHPLYKATNPPDFSQEQFLDRS